mmetsp:Transcript_14633/g.45212  ORF Transcript_14633/g.45212 Transcript_14633/m.45212 type:complete len:217 (-) Transcript_14633:253-903(-)
MLLHLFPKAPNKDVGSAGAVEFWRCRHYRRCATASFVRSMVACWRTCGVSAYRLRPCRACSPPNRLTSSRLASEEHTASRSSAIASVGPCDNISRSQGVPNTRVIAVLLLYTWLMCFVQYCMKSRPPSSLTVKRTPKSAANQLPVTIRRAHWMQAMARMQRKSFARPPSAGSQSAWGPMDCETMRWTFMSWEKAAPRTAAECAAALGCRCTTAASA